MKKITYLLFVLFTYSLSAQVDTFSLNNMPGNYFLGNEWFDYDSICVPQILRHSNGGYCNGLSLSYEALLCRPVGLNGADGVTDYGLYRYFTLDSLEGVNTWNQNHILNFAAGKHTDSPIEIAGVAFLYPRYFGGATLNGFVYTKIRDYFISHGYDNIVLQLMDSTMNILADGSVAVADSAGKPLFLFNKERKEVNEYTLQTSDSIGVDGSYFIFYDIYEAYFGTSVTISDSFYLAAHFESQQFEKKDVGVAIPGLYEMHHFMNSPATQHFFPRLTWKAQGGYRTVYLNATDYIHEPVDDSVWFSLDACEENHGYMLVFPILASDCGVYRGNVTWNPMGGGNVHLRWTPGSWDSEWEVSYGLVGTPAGGGTVISATSPTTILSGILFDTTYVAYVRSKCTVRDTVWSDWTDSVSIFIPSPHQGIASVSDGLTVDLQPNPATEQVEVTSSLPMARIVATDALGHRLLDRPATGLNATLDVSRWPAGAYLLQVHTATGIASRKLLVQ